MDKIEIKGAMRGYMRFPLYMLIPLALCALGMGIYDHKLIWPGIAIVLIYGLIAVIFFVRYKRLCVNALVDMAVGIETSQKNFLMNLPLPYAMINKKGRVLWFNKQFGILTGIDENTIKANVTSIFNEITHNQLNTVSNDSEAIKVNYEGRIFSVCLEKIAEDDGPNEGETLSVYAMILFDITRECTLEEKLDADKVVVANVIIDNYDETFAKGDEVKNSMLKAVIERKIRKYFGEADAVIRTIEKDKYFVIFPKRFLGKLIDDKFSLLEDIKNTKIAGDSQITLSVGIGLNGDSFVRDAEYAKTATDLALGRGGSQVVVKDGGDVSFYGIMAKEVTKNTRVKARVKAQALRELMQTRERVVVMGHSMADFDSLGASIGIAVAARELEKPCNMVINTITTSLRPLVNRLKESLEYGQGFFITSEEAMSLVDQRTLVVVVDTNRPEHTECPEILNITNDIVVFDHHRQGKDTIENPILSYQETYASSTCEMVAEILQYFTENISITPMEADALYAGMLIDTSNFMSKTGVRTFEAAAYLRRSGAEVTRVRKLLREDINAYKARAEVVRNATVYRDQFAISVCDTPELESPTIVGAQAANELLNIVGIKASFVLTEFKGKIYVSSRSIDEINVQNIMESLGGGGHLNVAGAQIEGSTIEEVSDRIRDVLDSISEEGDTK